MARIKKFSPKENLRYFETFTNDDALDSRYFRITEFKDTLTGGKNGFLIEGTPYLKESTEIKIEILDVEGNAVYYEPGDGIPEYYEGVSKVVAVYVYEDTPIGPANITILGELKQYVDDTGLARDIPDDWKGVYNVKWQRDLTINKNLPNEDKVRFFRRPKIDIEEIAKPIFLGNPNVVTQTGDVAGIPLVPNEGDVLTDFSLPTSYRLRTIDGTAWTGSILDQDITLTDLDFTTTVIDIVSKDEIVVSPPYSENGIVQSFTSEPYSVSFNYVEGVNGTATSFTGSFAKIKVTDLKTFVGDVANVKVFRRSQSQIADYEFIQEIQLESNELLRDIETGTATQVNYGLFTEPVLTEYWVEEGLTTTFDVDNLYNSVNLNGTEGQYFYTSQSLDIEQGVEYTLDFNVKKLSVNDNDSLQVFLSGSLNGLPYEQNIATLSSTTDILQKTNINENIIADNIVSASLYFEVEGSDWYVNSVSFKASEETSFSPDEITFVQQVPKTLQNETFDYRFDFYDINSNYIPVRVEESKTFTGGNLTQIGENLEVNPSQFYFTFNSSGNPLPPLSIALDVQATALTGSVTFTSGAYDETGSLIPSSSYSGGQYPGLLNDITGSPSLSAANFTGSVDSIEVQYITYTATLGGQSDTFTISRVREGSDGVDTFIGEIDPNPLVLSANYKGDVTEYESADTEITFRQGGLDLIYTSSGDSGTFYQSSIQSQSIDYGPISGDGSPSMSIVDFDNMTEVSASVTYNFDVYPYFTSSIVSRSLRQRFTKAVEGIAPIEIVFSPTNVTLNADEDGTLQAGDYTLGDTQISVREKDEYLLFTGSGERGTFEIVDASSTGITVSSGTGTNEYGSSDNDTVNYTVSDLTSDTGSVDYTIRVYPNSLNAVSPIDFTRSQTFSKTTDGTDARAVQLTTSTNVVVYDIFNRVTTPQGAITLTATSANTSGSAYYVFRDENDVLLQGPSTLNTYTVTDFPSSGSQNTYKVELLDGSPSSPVFSTDTVTITGIRDGISGYDAGLSNPIATINVDVGGSTDLTNTGTLIRAYKGVTELQYTQSYEETDQDSNGFSIYEGQFSASIFDNSPYITPAPLEEVNGELYASQSIITSWTDPQINDTAFITYKIDFENGEAEQFITQNIRAVSDGATGPGIVLRGEWTGSIDYIYDLEQSRRDAVIRTSDDSGNTGTYYFATTADLVTSSVEPFTTEPFTGVFDSTTTETGETGSNGWQYLGEQDFFVAAKIAIFEESFVENTINVGIPPVGSDNPQIAIVGGTQEPYISIGQTDTQGYLEEGIWLGIDAGTAVTESKFSLRSGTDGSGKFNSLEWDGEDLIIRGGIRQLPSGEIYEPVNRGYWQEGVIYYSGSIVQYAPTGEPTSSYSAIQAHTGSLTTADGGPNEPPSASFWQIYAEGAAGTSGVDGAGADARIISLLSTAQAFVEQTDGTLTPSEIDFTASLQNLTGEATYSAVPSVTLITGTNDNFQTLTSANFGSNDSVTVTAESGTQSDKITIVRLVQGSDAITTVNTNQSHTVPTDSSGGSIVWAGSSTTLKVFEGATALSYVGYDPTPSISNGQWVITEISASGILGVGDTFENNIAPDIVDDGDNAIIPDLNSTNFNFTDDVATVTYSLFIQKQNGDTNSSIVTVQTLTKSKTGEAGTSGTDGTSGTQGEPGPGVVYRGEWESGIEYFSTDTRTDVVKGSDGEYYLATTTHTSTTSTEPITGGSYTTVWESFGATFESVATDILFAQDVYANRTVNIGTNNGEPVIALNAGTASSPQQPYISIGQDPAGYNEEGIYLGYNNSFPVASFISGSGVNQSGFRFNPENGSFELDNIELLVTSSFGETSIIGGIFSTVNASIQGSIVSNDATLGAWTLDEDKFSSDGLNIILDATNQFIQVKEDVTGTVKFETNTNSNLPNISSGGDSGTLNDENNVTTSSLQSSIGGGFGSDSVLVTSSLGIFQAQVSEEYTIEYNYNSFASDLIPTAVGLDAEAEVGIYLGIRETGSILVGDTATSRESVLVQGRDLLQFFDGTEGVYDRFENQFSTEVASKSFTLKSNLTQNTWYEVYVALDANVNIDPNRSPEGRRYVPGATIPNGTGSIDYNATSFSQGGATYDALPSKTTINGGGFQTIVSPTAYFEVNANSDNNYTSSLKGGLGVDALYQHNTDYIVDGGTITFNNISNVEPSFTVVKAVAVFQGTATNGSTTVARSINVSDVVRTAQGEYRVDFDKPFDTNSYGVLVTASDTTGGTATVIAGGVSARAVDDCNIELRRMQSGHGLTDDFDVCTVMIIG